MNSPVSLYSWALVEQLELPLLSLFPSLNFSHEGQNKQFVPY